MFKLLKEKDYKSLKKKESELNAILKNQEKFNTPLEFLRKDKNGVRYYQFKDILSIRGNRAVAAEVAAKELSMGVTTEQEIKMFETVFEHINNEDFVKAIHLLRETYNRVGRYVTKDIMLNIATVYIVMEGEDPDNYDINWRNKKLEAWAQDDEIEGFFLSKAWSIIKDYTNISEQDIQTYLTRTLMENEKYQELLQMES